LSSVPSAAPAATPAVALIADATRAVRRVGAWILFLLCYVFLYAPLVMTTIFSFNDSTVQALPFDGFTTRWYSALFHDATIFDALKRSVFVAAMAVLLGALVGTAFAFLFDRVRLRGASLLQGLIAIPMLLPGIVLGLSLAITFRFFGVQAGLPTVIIGHASFVTPLIMFIVLIRLKRLDPALEQASMDCGAGRVRTFLYVTFPQIRTTLLGACLLGFTLSFDEIIVTFFLVGPNPTLPVYVWNQLRFGFTPEINAIFSCIAMFSFVVVVLATRLVAMDIRRGRGFGWLLRRPAAEGVEP
jgi:ABC-type spermidine/putrescine transport system permease subunit II